MEVSLSGCKCSIKNIRLIQEKTLEEVSSFTNIPIDVLKGYEQDPGNIPLHEAVKLLSYYKINFKNIMFFI